jgi:hypothetical protein
MWCVVVASSELMNIWLAVLLYSVSSGNLIKVHMASKLNYMFLIGLVSIIIDLLERSSGHLRKQLSRVVPEGVIIVN